MKIMPQCHRQWKVLRANGKPLANARDKTVRWYMSRGLMREVGDSTVQFIHEMGDFEPSQYRCAVCGTEGEITRHHIIPFRVWKFVPTELKDAESTILLCCKHHAVLEQDSGELDLTLQANGVPLFYLGVEALNKLESLQRHCSIVSQTLTSTKLSDTTRVGLLHKLQEARQKILAVKSTTIPAEQHVYTEAQLNIIRQCCTEHVRMQLGTTANLS